MVTEIGLKIVKAVQGIENGFFDFLFSALTMFGEELLIIVILAIVYFAVSKDFGEYLGYSLLTSLLLNASVKNIVKADRPFQADSSIINKRPSTSDGFSFPSGHTQGATSVWASLYVYARKNWILIVGLVITIGVAISRLYLGVHFPKDVIVGWLLAVLVAVLTRFLFLRFKSHKHLLFFLTGLVFVPFLFFATTKDFFTNFGLYYGFVLGVFLENKFSKLEDTKTIWKKIVRIAIFILFLVGIKEGMKFILPDANWAHTVRYFLMGALGLFLSTKIIVVCKL